MTEAVGTMLGRQLLIVNGGQLTASSADGESCTLSPGDFWISEADTKHTITAGPGGAVFVETWPVWVQLKTTWYAGHAWSETSN